MQVSEARIRIAVVMGSDSDWPTMQHAVAVLAQFGVAHEARVISAHRTPDAMFAYAESAAARGLHAIIAGAGGAARGVAPALLDAGIGDLYIVNRTAARADALADALGEPGRVHPRYLEHLPEIGDFSLIVNATSAARDCGLPPLPRTLLAPRGAAVDLSYGEVAIPFISWARAHEAQVAVDGLGMLVEQAAESFRLWHGVRPDTGAIYEHLRQQAAALMTGD